MSKKNIILIIVISVLFVAALIGVYFLTKEDESLSISGTVLITGDNYIILETKDGDYLVENASAYQVGDKVKITYKKSSLKENTSPKEITAQEDKLIQASKTDRETEIIDNEEEIENNSSNIPSTNNTNNNNTSKNKTNNSSKQNTNNSSNNVTSSNNSGNTSKNTTSNSGANNSSSQVTKSADEEVLAYVNTLQTNANNGITDTLKSGFITIVDFLFYDGTIAGHTFSELTTSAKLEVLKAALWVDDKIDSVFPGYKETISNGANKVYTSVKSMIVSTYLDITTSICSSHSDLCASAKEDFQSLKQSFGFTWDMIKDLASSGLDKLKNWYEIWSGK